MMSQREQRWQLSMAIVVGLGCGLIGFALLMVVFGQPFWSALAALVMIVAVGLWLYRSGATRW